MEAMDLPPFPPWRVRVLQARRSTYIFVLEEAQHLQLAEHTLRGHERLENVGQLLECDPASITRIGDSPANEKRKKKKIG